MEPWELEHQWTIIKPNKDSRNKTKLERNLAVAQKSFSISSLVCKSSAVASKDPQAVATTVQSASCATSISGINLSSSAALKAETALAMKSVTSHFFTRTLEEFPQLV